MNYDVIPSIIYTHPEVAWCGKTEEEVKASGAKYTVGTFPFAANSRARTNDDAAGLVKFVSCADIRQDPRRAHRRAQRRRAARRVRPGDGVRRGTEDIAHMPRAPTLSEAVKEAALATGGKPIHF